MVRAGAGVTVLDVDADGDLVDYGDIVARFPKAYQPELLRRPLNRLPADCEWITRYRDGSGIGLDVLGVSAWFRTVLSLPFNR